jgi:hypothetical protein
MNRILPAGGAVLSLVLAKLLLFVHLGYQVGTCGDTENERSSSGCAYQFCFKVCNGLRLKHKLLQEGPQEFIGLYRLGRPDKQLIFRLLRIRITSEGLPKL